MSKITLKDIREVFPNYTSYTQQGSKQLFVCSGYAGKHTADHHNEILVSYLTIVGYYDAKLYTWVLTRERYSVTTTQQVNWFAKGRNVTWIDALPEVSHHD